MSKKGQTHPSGFRFCSTSQKESTSMTGVRCPLRLFAAISPMKTRNLMQPARHVPPVHEAAGIGSRPSHHARMEQVHANCSAGTDRWAAGKGINLFSGKALPRIWIRWSLSRHRRKSGGALISSCAFEQKGCNVRQT